MIKNLEINSIKDLTLISCTLFENNKFNEVVNLLTAAFKTVSHQVKVFMLSECEFTLASALSHLDRNEEALKYIALDL